jgi:sensor domain CHASE-containing protein
MKDYETNEEARAQQRAVEPLMYEMNKRMKYWKQMTKDGVSWSDFVNFVMNLLFP